MIVSESEEWESVVELTERRMRECWGPGADGVGGGHRTAGRQEKNHEAVRRARNSISSILEMDHKAMMSAQDLTCDLSHEEESSWESHLLPLLPGLL